MIKINIYNNKFEKKNLNRVKSGRNNFVYTFQDNRQIKLLKLFRDRKRFIKEVNFLQQLKKNKISSVPRIELLNINKKYYVSNFIKGKEVKTINKKKINSCLNFIKKINKKNRLSQNATDACLSLNDHCKIVQKNISLIKKFFIKDKKLKNIINETSKEFIDIKKKLQINKKKFYEKINTKNTILSPSDFGFHNIKIHKKRLFFFDFEYSGLDDPMKLICDFFCQPDYEVDIKFFPYFTKKIMGEKNFNKNKSLYKLLLKIHSIKWICILIKHLYNNPNKLKGDYQKKKFKIYKYFKKTKLSK